MNAWKTVNLRFAVLVLIGLAVGSTARADAPPKLIVVVNRADWCSVCKTHGERAGKALLDANSDGAIKVVINDVTSEETSERSAMSLKAAGLDKAMGHNGATGVLHFFDAKTKRPLRQITVANTDDEIKMVIQMARKEASR